MIASPHLVGRDRYERAIEAWVDNTHPDAFTHTARVTDSDCAIEVRAVCTPSPGYEVREARARVLGGAADPAIAADLPDLSGARMIQGFTRRLAGLCGARAGAALFVDAGIEVARLARQVAKVPAAATVGLRPGDARQCWNLDRAAWHDLPDSCYTYSAAGEALLGRPEARSTATLDLYTALPGARRVFVRTRQSRLVATADRLHLFHALHDNVHGFDLHVEIDRVAGRVAAAECVTSRLPYLGICDQPQGRVAALTGQVLDAGLRKRIQTLIGGATGCAQLYDATADLLKLLALD
jgi:hypothetical protein